MRVLQLVDLYPPAIGGTEKTVYELTSELTRRGHSVAVATVALGGSKSSVTTEQGVRVYRCGQGLAQRLPGGYQNVEAQPFHVPAPDPGITLELRRIIRKEKPDLIHSHNWILYSLLGAGVATPILQTIHDYGLVCHKRTYLHRNSLWCEGPALMKCSACGSSQYGPVKSAVLATSLRISRSTLNHLPAKYTAVSQAVRQASLLGARGREIEVVPAFYQRDSSVPVDRPSFLPSDDYILYVGALSGFKGLYVLLEAYKTLGAEVPPLVVIGTPRDDTPTEWPANTIVRQDVDHSTVLACWDHCLFGVVPSVWAEPFGRVALEAMSSKKAVIASRVGGLKDLIEDGTTGLLVEPGNASELAAAISTLLRNPDRAARMGVHGEQAVKAYSVSAVTTTYERIYAELVAP